MSTEPETLNLEVRVDAAAIPNPGAAGCGIEVVDLDTGLTLYRGHRFLGDGLTSPQAELLAIVEAVRAYEALFGDGPTTVVTDAQVAVRWVSGEYGCHKPHLFEALEAAKKAIHSGDCELQWRKKGAYNAAVDAEAKLAAQERHTSPELNREESLAS